MRPTVPNDNERAGLLSRRGLVLGLPLLIAACQTKSQAIRNAGLSVTDDGRPDYAVAYGPVRDGGFNLPGHSMAIR